MQQTTNYNLKKPGMTDTVADSIPAYATNFDTIDTLIKGLDDDKVDKEVGKGLSANDYTTDEKNKLAGIEAGAEVNNISDEDANELTGGEETNLHKHAAADVNYGEGSIETAVQEISAGVESKVDKEVGKGLSTNDYTTAEKNKLAGIEAGAEVNNISDEDANELTGGEETNLHKHAAADVNYGEGSIETAVQEISAELVTHKADTMPHLIRDITNNKTYRYGYQIQDGVTQLIFEEVV